MKNDKKAQKLLNDPQFQKNWASHMKSFGPILKDAFAEDPQGRVTLCAALTNITGNTTLSLLSAFQAITATSVTGDLAIDAPIDACDAVLRSVAGRIRTCGVSIVEGAPISVHFSSVSGVLDMTWTEGQ